MKKTLIALVILTLSFGVAGCAFDKEETTSNSNEVVTQEESKEKDKRSDDEMYELYTSKLEEVEKLFTENNIDFKERKSEKNKKFEGKTSISYEDSGNEAVNIFTIGRYGIAFDNDSAIKYISSQMTLKVNEEETKNKEFKFEDTEFYKLHSILIPDIKNSTEIDQKVNAVYKDLTSIETIEFEYDNVTERIVLGDNRIDYTIIINP